MKTTLDTRAGAGLGGASETRAGAGGLLDMREGAGPSGIWPSARGGAPGNTWATISAVDRLRVRPAWPVAQNGQPIPQPACDDTHIVTRSVYFISTDSTRAPSSRRHSIFLVAPSSQVS